MKIDHWIALRYLYGGRRSSAMRSAAFVAAGIAAAGVVILAVGGSGLANAVGSIAVIAGLLGAAICGLLSTFSVFTGVSVLGVAIGVAALTVVLAVTTGFQQEFREKVMAGRAHVTVLSGEGTFPGYDKVMAKAVAADPDIIGAQPFLYAEVLVTRGKGELSGVEIKGIDPARVAQVFDLSSQIVEGSLAPLGEPRAEGTPPPILIGRELAHKLKAKLGDSLTVVMPQNFSFGAWNDQTPSSPRTRVFKIAGIFYSGFDEYDRHFTYASLHDAQQLVGCGDQALGIELKLRDPERAGEVAREIEQVLQPPYEAQDWYEVNHNLFSALNIQKLALVIILTLIIAVAAFNMVSALTMMVTDKTREIAILKSMGATSSAIGRIFRTVGLAIGMVGTLVGVGVGLVVCHVVSQFGYRLDARVYMIDHLPIDVRPDEVLLVAAITLVISVLATVMPAASAASLSPLDGLRAD